jgi:hypothetical protein
MDQFSMGIVELVGGPSFSIFNSIGMVGVTKGERMREIIKGIGSRASSQHFPSS